MGGGSQVKPVLVSTLQGTLHQGQVVAVKVDTATASGPGSHQKEVRSSLGWADRHNFKQQIQVRLLIKNCPSNRYLDTIEILLLNCQISRVHFMYGDMLQFCFETPGL